MTDLPRPAPAHFPYREHRTIAEVDHETRLAMIRAAARKIVGNVLVPPSVRIR